MPANPRQRHTDLEHTIARRIRRRRNELGYSQADLACHLGITYQQLQKYEAAHNRVAASTLYRCAEALDVPLSYFFATAADPATDRAVAHDPLLGRLVRAYAHLPSRELAQALITLAEGAAAPHAAPPS